MIAFIGGLARSAVGAGWLSRGLVYPQVALACAYWAFGWSWRTLAFAAVSALTLWLGRTKWQRSAFMVLRYGALAWVLTVLHVATGGSELSLIWPVMCGLVGHFYDDMLEAFADISFSISLPFTDIQLHIDGARIAEFIAGTVIIGGVSLL